MSTWSQLEQLLTCAICLDRFRNPKLLPCQHTFCGEPCMDGLVDYARRQIKCPECRAEHRIPYNGVQSFPNNVTLSRFLDLHRSITGEEPEPLPSAMEKCGVCGEKSFCTRCAHCEKKVCEECGVAHLDILRREIVRINQQVRRSLSKLTEQSEQASSREDKLAQIAASIRDEITEGVRRFIKDLKDREAKLLAELDQFTTSESKNCSKLNEDLEIELATITSNCELTEEHITETDDWSDAELMEYKDIFLKTLDFLRNLDPDTIELGRKIKYLAKVDLDSMRRQALDFGELKITQPATFGLMSGQLSPSDSTSNLALPGALMRSQSDHRLAAQFAANQKSQLQRSYLDVTGAGQARYGEEESASNRRADRYGSVRSNEDKRERDPYSYTRGFPRPGDDQYEPSGNFRSRFMRDRLRERTGGTGSDDHSFEDHDSDVGSGSHRVRFQQEDVPTKLKLFDTEEMANMRTPLSGLIKLMDSPFVMERLHQNQVKAKEKKDEAPKEESRPAPPPPTRPATTPAPKPSRQISEDEVEKQKKQAQAQAAQSSTKAKEPTTPTSTTTPTATRNVSPNTPANRRVAALQRETGRLSSSRSGSPSEATSGADESDLDNNVTTHTTSSPSATSRRRIFSSNHSNSSTSNAPTTPATQPEVATRQVSQVNQSIGNSNTTNTNNTDPNNNTNNDNTHNHHHNHDTNDETNSNNDSNGDADLNMLDNGAETFHDADEYLPDIASALVDNNNNTQHPTDMEEEEQTPAQKLRAAARKRNRFKEASAAANKQIGGGDHSDSTSKRAGFKIKPRDPIQDDPMGAIANAAFGPISTVPSATTSNRSKYHINHYPGDHALMDHVLSPPASSVSGSASDRNVFWPAPESRHMEYDRQIGSGSYQSRAGPHMATTSSLSNVNNSFQYGGPGSGSRDGAGSINDRNNSSLTGGGPTNSIITNLHSQFPALLSTPHAVTNTTNGASLLNSLSLESSGPSSFGPVANSPQNQSTELLNCLLFLSPPNVYPSKCFFLLCVFIITATNLLATKSCSNSHSHPNIRFRFRKCNHNCDEEIFCLCG